MHRGYVKLWRKTRDTGILQDGPSSQFFLKALLDSAHRPSKRMVGKTLIDLNPGEFVFGRGQWASDLQVSEKVLRRVLKNFEKWAIIRASKRASKFTIYELVNWHLYQSDEDKQGQQKGQDVGQQRASRGPHKEECKECKEWKKEESTLTGTCQQAAPDGPPPCPHQDIIALYHEILPELRKVRVWDANREKLLRARWRAEQKRQTLDYWRGYFEYVRKCPLLMGLVDGQGGREPFQADLEWLVRPTNFNKVIEGRYEAKHC